MSRKIRVGLVGTSWWSDLFFLPALKSHPGADLAAICGRNGERAQEMADKYGVPAVFTDYGEMIERGNLEAVVIATSDETHHAIAMRALEAGLPVMCEKPLALTAQQAREMVEMAEAQGVKTLVNFSYRWMPFFRYFYDLAQQDYVGRLYHAEFRYLGGYARGRDYMWRFDQDRANGVLGDLGSHFIHLAHWLVGDIRRVQAHLGVHVQRDAAAGGPLANPANDSALLLVEFAGGAHGVIHASSVAHEADRGTQQHVSLFGEGGTLEITANYGGAEDGALIQAARTGENAFQTLPVPDSYWAGVDPANPWGIFTQHSAGARAFVDALLGDGPAAPDFRDGYKAQLVIDAAYASHRSGEAIAIPNA